MTKQVVYRKIPVTERLPEKEGLYFCFWMDTLGNLINDTLYFDISKFHVYEEHEIVTHWLEAIELPSEEEIIKRAIEVTNEEDSFREKIISNASFFNGANYLLDKIFK